MDKKLQQLGNIIKSLNEVNQTFYNEVVRLNKENAYLAEANQRAHTENNSLIAELKAMNEKNQSTIEAFNIIHKETENRNNTLKKAQQELDNTIKQAVNKAVNKAVTDERTKKDNEINQIRAGHKAEIQELKGTINNQTIKINTLTKSNTEMTKIIEQNKNTIQEKEKAINYYKDEKTKAENFYKKEIKDKIDQKQELINKYENTINTQQEKITKQEEEIEKYIAKIKKQDEEITKYKAKEVKININSNPTEPPQTQVTVYGQRTIYSQEKGFVTSQAVVAQATNKIDDEYGDEVYQEVEKLHKDEIKNLKKKELQGKIDELQTEIQKLTEANNKLYSNSQENRSLRQKAEDELKVLTSHLVTVDKWKVQDIQQIIEAGMKKNTENNSQGTSDNGYSKEINPY